MKTLSIFISLIFSVTSTWSQEDTLFNLSPDKKTDPPKHLFDELWAPVGLCGLGVSLMADSSKYGLQSLIQQPFNGFKTDLDDYIQFAPIVFMYGLDGLGVQAKNTPWNQTKYLAFSELGTCALVQLLKYTARVPRPDGSKNNSFPSGHTSQAFVAAQVFYHEYHDTQPLLSYTGFAFSVTTGTLRIVNNRHWISDVLVGAGIGILVTNLVYYFEPLKNWNPFGNKSRKTSMGFVPVWDNDYLGGYFRLNF